MVLKAVLASALPSGTKFEEINKIGTINYLLYKILIRRLSVYREIGMHNL